MLRCWLTSIVLCVESIAGCGHRIREVPPRAPIIAAAPALPEPVAVPDTMGGKPSWLQPVDEDATRALRGQLGDLESERAGREGALIATAAGWFWVDRAAAGRIHGPMKLPSGARWAGVIDHEGADAIVSATSDGRVHVAATILDAVEGRFVTRGALPHGDASRWDAATTYVAAARGDEVFVSRDGGGRFSRSRPRRGAKVSELLVRYDGVVVAQTEGPTTWLSRAGAGWQRSPYQPEGVERVGGQLIDTGGCGISLSADGATWLDPTTPSGELAIDIAAQLARHGSHEEIVEAPTWGAAMSLGSAPWPRRMPRLFGVDVPAAVAPPPTKRRAVGAAKRCANTSDLLGGLVDGAMRGVGASCSLARCLPRALGDAPHDTALGYYALGDSYCAGEARCTRDAELIRSPTLVVLDARHDAVRLVAPPPGCAIETVLSVSGMGVALCRVDSRTRSVFTIDPSGALHHDASTDLGGTDPSLRVADDGTLLLTTGDRTWVRAPLPIGSSGAWRNVTMSGAHAYRPLRGGLALVVRSDRVDGADLALYVDRPAAAPEHITTALLSENLLDVEVIDGRVVLTTHPTAKFRPHRDNAETALIRRWLLLSDGSLTAY